MCTWQAAEKLVLAEGTKMVMAALQTSYNQVRPFVQDK